MPKWIGAHADRAQAVGELLGSKGRRAQGRFAFEGPTLLDEALRSDVEILEIYATERAFEASATLDRLDAQGLDVFLVDDRVASKISDLETPTGIVSVAKVRYAPAPETLAGRLTLVLADVGDPGNAGTLLRSAEAFGVTGLIFGRFGVDPYHPKVVRGSMGAVFRLPLTVATPDEIALAAPAFGTLFLGLAANGDPIEREAFAQRCALVVGQERHGLGTWENLCTRRVAIAMRGRTESLNAAVAGSIALYEASKHM